MKIVIIEDERLIAKNLQMQLKKIAPNFEVIATLESVAEAVKWLQENEHPNLFFMDIQLSDGVSFSIFNQVTIDKPVIFTTAYNEYAIHAFKVNSVDYLLKPVEPEALEKAVAKFNKHFTQQSKTNEQWQDLVNMIQNQNMPKYKERFLVHQKSGMTPILEKDIAYFLKDTIIYLVLHDNTRLVTDFNTIDEIEEVANPHLFFRANRQVLLYINQIDSYKKHDTGKIEIHLKCDKNFRIDVSREKASTFVDWLGK
jgi:two-component system LytT family response regulator